MSKILLIKQLQKKLLKKSKLSFLSKNISTLILIPPNIFRPADQVLSGLRNDPNSLSQLQTICSFAQDFIDSTLIDTAQLVSHLNKLISNSWLVKREMSGIMTDELTTLYNRINSCLPTNWIRLIGAGRGGYFLVSSQLSIAESLLIFDQNNINGSISACISHSGLVSSTF